jgi:hypothetical protein
VYETVTNSCLSTSGGKETPLYRRTTVPKTDYGVIKDGKLYAAEKLLIYSDSPNFTNYGFGGNLAEASNMEMGQEVWITKTGPNEQYRGHFGVASINADGMGERGYYLKSELFGTRKHFDAIMLPDFSREIYTLQERDNERLKTLLKLYTHDKDGVNQTLGHNEYRGFLQAKVKPVYYSNVDSNADDKYYISPACITKEVFDRSVESILKSQGGFDACKESNNLCEACHLFGMVGKGGEGEVDARSSRIQFRDALPTESGGYMGGLRTMAILGSPKITAAEFYMEDPGDCDIYNYDYKSSYNGNARRMIPTSLSDNEVRLRGRKFYWHHRNLPKTAGEKDRPDLYLIVRPVKAEKTFEFTVAFERLTADELSKLRYALELEEKHYEKTNKQAHKLGHGKPIGYGSVQIGVDEKKSKIYSVNENLEITGVDLKDAGLPDKVWSFSYNRADFLALTDFKNRRSDISYPIGRTITETTDETQRPPRTNSKTDEGVYNWFTLNKEATGGNSTSRPKLASTLPYADEQNPESKEITKTVSVRKYRQPDGQVREVRTTEYSET